MELCGWLVVNCACTDHGHRHCQQQQQHQQKKKQLKTEKLNEDDIISGSQRCVHISHNDVQLLANDITQWLLLLQPCQCGR